jgi:alkanesulfonate monooxygenase SsuD/methylene tetrahydromethanopterin reductase-like flavin-dependent oxidoreductase (luciferase family)
MRIGYFLSSEEFDPRELITQARLAEDAGFQGLWISDHYHPWNDRQGHSGFVWSTIGALSQATSTMNVTPAATSSTSNRSVPTKSVSSRPTPTRSCRSSRRVRNNDNSHR